MVSGTAHARAVFAQLAERVGPEHPTDDAGALQHALHRGIGGIETRRDESLQRRGHRDGARPALEAVANKLLGVQRIALTALHDLFFRGRGAGR